jgi:putative oxidoreductase
VRKTSDADIVREILVSVQSKFDCANKGMQCFAVLYRTNTPAVKRNLIVSICAILLIILFVYTGASKWVNLRSFLVDINNQPLPDNLTPTIAFLLPASELMTAVLLLWDKLRLIGLLLATVIMSVFTIYSILITAGVFENVPCACGGMIRGLSWPQHLLLNFSFLVIALVGLLMEQKSKSEQCESTDLDI